MKKSVSIVEARQELGRLAEEVRRTGKSVALTRRGRVIARIAPDTTTPSKGGGALGDTLATEGEHPDHRKPRSLSNETFAACGESRLPRWSGGRAPSRCSDPAASGSAAVGVHGRRPTQQGGTPHATRRRHRASFLLVAGPMDAAGPNAEQIRYWNETAGPKWVALAGDARRADPAARRGGDGSRRASRRRARARRRLRHGPDDARARASRRPDRRRHRRRHLGAHARRAPASAPARPAPTTSTFVAGRRPDAPLRAGAPSTSCFSRFGVMFFADPTAAFANLHAALRPGRPARLRLLAGAARQPVDVGAAHGGARSTSRCRCRRRPTRRGRSRSPTPTACATSSSAPASATSAFDDHRATLTVGGGGGARAGRRVPAADGADGRGAARGRPRELRAHGRGGGARGARRRITRRDGRAHGVGGLDRHRPPAR